MIGQTVSHYNIREKLGGGGMGVVYKAEDTLLKRTVALKFLPPTLTTDPEAKERFIHEARAASALDHPSICTIHEIGQTDDGQLFIVMACYEGETLKKKVGEGSLNIDLALDIAIQAASGLSRAHEAGIVHRDIKPANIMLTTHNEVKILDFGLAKLGGGSVLTRTGTTLGTAAYMSPEQARGEQVDQRSDIWSLGAVLYELLTGQRAFLSDYEQALVYSILNEEPKRVRSLRPDVPEVVEQVVFKALSKRLEDRYQTAEEVLSDLKIARGMEAPGGTIVAAEAAKRREKKTLRRRLLVAGLAAAVLAVGLFVVLPLIQDQALASNPKAIAFISFENSTGDGSLDYLRSVLPRVLGTTLEDSKYIRITKSERLRELMKQIGKEGVEFINRETGLLLCRRAGIDVMGVGNYTKAGPLFLAELEMIDVTSGERLGSVLKVRGRGEESFLESDGIVDDLARQVSRGMGVSQLSTRATLKSVAELSSSSIEAQRYYQRGKLEREKMNFKEARSILELATKKDTTFALAWFQLAECFSNLGDGPGLRDAVRHMRSNLSRTTELEKFQMAQYDTNLQATLLKSRGREWKERNWASFAKARAEIFPFEIEFRVEAAGFLRNTAAIAEYESILKLDNLNAQAWLYLGYSYLGMGEGVKAIQAFERNAELQPGDPNPLHSMAEAYLTLGRIDEGIAKCEEVLRLKSDFYGASLTLAKLHFMKESYDDAIAWTDRGFALAPSRFNQANFLWWRAFYLVWAGRLNEAESALKKSEGLLSAEYGFDRFVLDRITWLGGWIAHERGERREARARLAAWAATYSDKYEARLYPEFCLGLLDLQEGMVDSVNSRVERMKEIVLTGSRLSWDWSAEDFWRYYGQALHGAYLLAVHRPEEIRPTWVPTRESMQAIDPRVTACWPIMHCPNPGLSEVGWIPVPFDIVPRALAERGMIDSAIASYERALKKPPHWLGPIIPRYYYRLARLYEQKGMKDKAIENYTTFLKVWGKADPIYKEPADARVRLARLKRG